jgi:hypothetical protein
VVDVPQRSPQALSLASLSKLTLYKVGSGQPQSSTHSNAKLRQRVRPRVPVATASFASVSSLRRKLTVVFVFGESSCIVLLGHDCAPLCSLHWDVAVHRGAELFAACDSRLSRC